MIYYISNRENIAKGSNVTRITEIEAYNMLKRFNVLYEDTETTTLDFLQDRPVKLLQLGNGIDAFIFDTRSVKLPNIKLLLEDPKILKVLVNLYFERNMLRSLNIDLRGGFDLSLAYAAYRMGRELRFVEIEGESHFIYSFAGMYANILGIKIDKEQQTSFIGEGEFYSNAQLEYAARDVMIEDLYINIRDKCIKKGILHPDFNLWEDARTQLKKGIFKMVTLEMMVAPIFADIMYNGIGLDEEAWVALHDKNKQELLEVERELNKELIERLPEYKGIRIEPFKNFTSKQFNIFGELEIVEHKKKDDRRINWNSNPKKKEIFYKMFKELPVDKKGKESIGVKELKKYNTLRDDSFIYKLIKRGGLSKRISSFGRAYLTENLHPKTRRIHPQINQILETGRVAWRKPNLAQIPNSEEYRNCFVPKKGYDLVACDYSGQESRVMAFLANDKEFIDFFENGDGDSHSMVASRVYSTKYGREIIVSKKELKIASKPLEYNEILSLGKSLFPNADIIVKSNDNKYLIFSSSEGDKCPLRQYGKILNFFISFGGSAYTLSIEQGISKQEASTLIQGYWNSFKGLKKFFDNEKKLALENGYIIAESVTNTLRWLPKHREMIIERNKLKRIKEDLISKYGNKKGSSIYFNQVKTRGSEINTYTGKMFRLKGDIERAAMNTRIQTTASRMTKLAAILIDEEIRKNNLDIHPVNAVHDELLYEIKENTNHEKLVQQCMEEASELLVNRVIPAEPAKGKVWIH